MYIIYRVIVTDDELMVIRCFFNEPYNKKFGITKAKINDHKVGIPLSVCAVQLTVILKNEKS